jgi:hypothetical protein
MEKYINQGMHAEQASKFARKELALFGAWNIWHLLYAWQCLRYA